LAGFATWRAGCMMWSRTRHAFGFIDAAGGAGCKGGAGREAAGSLLSIQLARTRVRRVLADHTITPRSCMLRLLVRYWRCCRLRLRVCACRPAVVGASSPAAAHMARTRMIRPSWRTSWLWRSSRRLRGSRRVPH
jgi:hypothetical protein